jgi:fructose-1-phosphate kinase PfkB-like protein
MGPGVDDLVELPGQAPLRRKGGTPLYAARALRFAGAEPVAIEGPTRAGSRLVHTPGGTMQELTALAEPLDPDWVAREALPRLRGCTWVVLGGQSAGDFPVETVELLAGAGHLLLLDAQGLARGHRTGPLRLARFEAEAVRGVQALKLNALEAQALMGEAGLAGLDHLGVPEVLLSRGHEGLEVIDDGRHSQVAPAPHRFVDPTGAGDSLSALYCLARTRGSEPAEAAGWAAEQVERLYTS